jgi:hypothetical protein
LENSPLARAVREMENSPFARAIREMENSPLARAIREMENSPLARAACEMTWLSRELARTRQWASALGNIVLPEIAKLYPTFPNAAADIARPHELVGRSVVSVGFKHDLGSLGLGLATTRVKMSALAGITASQGTYTPAWSEAYRSLFGEWRTRPDLPKIYWRDARTRRRMYEAADVDPGLARTGLKAAVEVVVESGLMAGARSDAATAAVITLDDVTMTIRSAGTR